LERIPDKGEDPVSVRPEHLGIPLMQIIAVEFKMTAEAMAGAKSLQLDSRGKTRVPAKPVISDRGEPSRQNVVDAGSAALGKVVKHVDGVLCGEQKTQAMENFPRL
jgi:hypothetical protein